LSALFADFYGAGRRNSTQLNKMSTQIKNIPALEHDIKSVPVLKCKTRAEFQRAWNWLCACGIANTTHVSELTIEIGCNDGTTESSSFYVFNAAPDLLEAVKGMVKEVHAHGLLNVKKRFGLCTAVAQAGTAIHKAGSKYPVYPVRKYAGEEVARAYCDLNGDND
jgi:hypothetical protein